jgi:hypothetical protein
MILLRFFAESYEAQARSSYAVFNTSKPSEALAKEGEVV